MGSDHYSKTRNPCMDKHMGEPVSRLWEDHILIAVEGEHDECYEAKDDNGNDEAKHGPVRLTGSGGISQTKVTKYADSDLERERLVY